MQEVR